MRKHLLVLLMLVLFCIEGTIMMWIIPPSWQTEIKVAPHFVFVAVLFLGLFVHRHFALLYGVGFGLLHDVVHYGPMIGTFSFAMGFIGYCAGLMSQRTRGSIASGLVITTLGLFLFEGIIYGLYRLFQYTHVPPDWVFLHQMLPSTLINLLFALLIYVPLRKFLESITFRTPDEEDS